MNLKLFLDFEPCEEYKISIQKLGKKNFFNDTQETDDESAKFLRHLTYNHTELVKGIVKEVPKQKRDQDFNWFR